MNENDSNSEDEYGDDENEKSIKNEANDEIAHKNYLT